jgi:hypothetical protein
MRQLHGRSSNSCASPPLLRDYCCWQPSSAAQCHTQQHSYTATQQHYQHRKSKSNTQTPKHTVPQLHTPQHCTLNVLVTTVVTHNGGAGLYTRPRPREAASSAATPRGTHNTSSTVLQSLPAHTLQQCDTATATCTIAGHASHYCAAWTASDRRRRRHRQHTRNTAPPLQRGGNARVHAAQRDAQTRTINREHNRTQLCAVTQQPQRSAAQRRTRGNTKPQSQYCGAAPYSLRSRQHRQCAHCTSRV